MPEEDESVRESREALDSAWASFHDAQRRRHTAHDLVRSIVRQRVADGFDEAFRKSMEPREQP